jgi:hypothetical protein
VTDERKCIPVLEIIVGVSKPSLEFVARVLDSISTKLFLSFEGLIYA